MVFIECSPQVLLVFENQLLDAAKVLRSHSPIVRQSNARIEPEFALAIGCSDVNMAGLHSFIRIEVKPK
jgi:hypothetical protein